MATFGTVLASETLVPKLVGSVKMASNSLLKVAPSPPVFSSPLTTLPHPSYFVRNLPPKPRSKLVSIKALSGDNERNQPSSSTEKSSLLTVVLDVPRTIWRQTLRPLSDFGFGRRSIWEGGVGLFLVSGAVLLALSLAWLRGFQLRARFRKYLAVFEFPLACGICTGTPVRIRGVTVGNVVKVNPSLKNVEAVAEVC